jgi:serine/threonine protein kinase
LLLNFIFFEINLYSRILGTPDTDSWADCKNLPHYKDTFPKWSPKNPEEIFPNLDTNGLNLLSKMLCYDPNKRVSAKQALLHVIIKNKFTLLIFILALFQKYKKVS